MNSPVYAIAPGPLMVHEMKVLHGANYFSWEPVVLLRLDLGTYDEVFTDQIRGFGERLKSMLPSLQQHHCSPGIPGGFFKRIDEGTLLGHVVEHVAIELQQLAGIKVVFGKTRATRTPGIYNVLFQFVDDEAGLCAGRAAVNLVNTLLAGEVAPVAPVIDALVAIRERRLLGPSTQAIVDAALARGIPTMRLDNYNLVQLGTGRYQKRIRATVTADTSLIATETALDKALSLAMLHDAAIPVPQTLASEDVEEILAFQAQLAAPLTLKPRQGTLGQGVSVGAVDATALRRAFDRARSFDTTVLAQTTIPGASYRLLVIGQRFIAAIRLDPPTVVGDGRLSISELIEQLNADPRREVGDKGLLTRIRFDETTNYLLAERGYHLNSVLPNGETLPLTVSGNLKLGGSAVDVTDEVHPINRFLAERVSQVIGLDIVGVDVVAPSLATPLTENGGAVIEVGAAPDFRPHLHPIEGIPRDVAQPMLDMLFPATAKVHMPVVSITGSRDRTFATELLACCLSAVNYRVGLASGRGLSIDGRRLRDEEANQPEHAALVLKDPTVDCAVLETAWEGILRAGLGYGLADVGVVLNVVEDDLANESVRLDDLSDLAYAMSVVAEQIHPEGIAVLNADQSLVCDMRLRLQSRVVWFTQSYANRMVRAHVRRGGAAVVADRGHVLVLENGVTTHMLIALDEIASLAGPRASTHLDAVLAVIAALYALGVPLPAINKGLRVFMLP